MIIEDIINGISNSLFNTFGESYAIYADKNVQQGLKNPCFFISCLNSSHETKLKNRYFRNHPFIVQYFPIDELDNFELLNVAEKLVDCLEIITLLNGDKIQGTSIKYEIVDGILHFKVNYNLFLMKITETDSMDEIKIRGV